MTHAPLWVLRTCVLTGTVRGRPILRAIVLLLLILAQSTIEALERLFKPIYFALDTTPIGPIEMKLEATVTALPTPGYHLGVFDPQLAVTSRARKSCCQIDHTLHFSSTFILH